MAIKPAESIEETMVPKPCPIPEGLVPPTPSALLVEGGVACGKTQLLVERAASVLQGGADPAEVLVFCATPDAAAAFSARLAQACARGGEVRVTTPREWCRDVLARLDELGGAEVASDSHPDAASDGDEVEAQAEADGYVRHGRPRGTRLLAPFEMNVLMEDLKVCGMRPQRLREMLRFFYKSMTQLCDWEQDWLLTGEELQTFGLLRECLDFEGAVLEAELSNSVARWLHDDGPALATLAVEHVLVDDYQMLSRASQVLANELARASIAVAANPPLCVEVFESYPYADGVAEFLAANPQAEHVVLNRSHACAAAVAAVNGIAADDLVGAGAVEPAAGAADALLVDHAETPAAERDLVVRLVWEALAGGTPPQDVTVVAPNLVWQRNVCRALVAAGIPAAMPSDPKSVAGDLRELDLCVAARVLTALYLVADPGDGAAWRSWCGFGNLFLSSSAVKDIRAAACEQGIGAAEAFRTMEPELMGEVNRAEWAYVMDGQQTALQLLDGAQGKAGEELLVWLAQQVAGEHAEVPAEVRALVAPFADGSLAGDDAAAMAARARLRIDAPRTDAADAVRVVPLADITGTTPSAVILCGFVNGFLPVKGVLDLEIMVQEDADKQKAKDLRALMNAVGKPGRSLQVTYFDEVALEMAERMKMKIRRVQLHDGRRVALATPSVYLAQLQG